MNTSDFIKTVFINELKDIVDHHPYIAFMVMSTGIEFLGKCLDLNKTGWHDEGKSKTSFREAIEEIPSLQKYKPLLDKNGYDLYGSLRCGLLHSAQPKFKITLSSKEEAPHLLESIINAQQRINLKCEDFYADFKEACEWVINSLELQHSMNQPFLLVPGETNYFVGFANSSGSAT